MLSIAHGSPQVIKKKNLFFDNALVKISVIWLLEVTYEVTVLLAITVSLVK